MKTQEVCNILSKIALARFGIKSPLSVSWALTRQCNSRCAYCSYPTDDSGQSTEEVFALLSEFKKSGVGYVSLTGGEVLLRDDIGDIIRYAKKQGLFVKINTNALLLPEKIQAVLPVDLIQLSLDGGEAVHDAIRGEGCFQGALKGLACAVKHGKKVFINTVISSHNTGRLDQVLEIGAQFQVPILFQPAKKEIYGCHGINPVSPSREDFRRDILQLIASKKAGGTGKYIKNSFSGLQHFLAWPSARSIPCFSGLVHFRVDVHGCVHNCDDTESAHSVPVFPGGFSAALNELKYERCQACWCASQVESNLVMALRPEAVMNFLQHKSD